MDGIILINKAAGYTSHDIVNIARKALHTKKVGHCGTLDPDATGVLVLCINKATKVLQFLTSDTKEYVATLSLGTATDTYDASGKVLQTKEFAGITLQEVEVVLKNFLGVQKQIPPIYSAIKINGKKLYEYAHKGEQVKIEPRDIEIQEIELLQCNQNEISFRVVCSKGTYIRSLCVDIASVLGYPGHMKNLIRTKSGTFSIENCCSLEELQQGDFTVVPIEQALSSYKKIIVEDESIVYHGKLIKSDIEEQVVIYNTSGTALAVYGPGPKGYVKNIRGLW